MDGGTGTSGGGAAVSTNADGSQSVSITGTNGLAGSTDGSTGAGFSFLSDALSSLDSFSPESSNMLAGVGLDSVAPNTQSPDGDSMLNRFMKFALNQALGRYAPPALSKGLTAINAGRNASEGNYGKAALGLASLGVPGVGLALSLGPVLAGINSLSQPSDAAGIANAISYSGPGANGASTSQSGQSMNNILQGLAGLYMGNRYIKNLNNTATTLGSMYSQDSPYAQTMRQQLERRDSAAGRRSQYGPREVELQAALAGQYSKNAPYLNQLQGQTTQARLQQLMMLQKLLGGRNGLVSTLGGLFGGGSANDWFQGGQGVEATLGDWGG
jgi:hypothetical protein